MPKVYGSLIDTETRCRHYFTEEDIIAIKFKCCNKYYPCYKCHNEFEKHAILSVGLSLHLTKKQSYAVYANTN